MSDEMQNPTIHPAKPLLERLFIKIEDISQNGIRELPDGTRTIRFKLDNIDNAIKKAQFLLDTLHSGGFFREKITIDNKSLVRGIKISSDQADFQMQIIGSNVEAIFKPKMLFDINVEALSRNVRQLERQAGNRLQENYEDLNRREIHNIGVRLKLENLFNAYTNITRGDIRQPSGSQHIVRHPIKDNVQNTQILIDTLQKAGFIDNAPDLDKVIISDFKKANISNDKFSLKINIVKKSPTEGEIVVDCTVKDASSIDIKILDTAIATAKREFDIQQQKYSQRFEIGHEVLKEQLTTLMSSVKKSAGPDSKIWTAIKSGPNNSFSMTFNIDSEHNSELAKVAQKLLEKFKDGEFISSEELRQQKFMQDGFNFNNDKCSLSGRFEAGKLTVNFAPKEKLYKVLGNMGKLVAENGQAPRNRLSDNGPSQSLSI